MADLVAKGPGTPITPQMIAALAAKAEEGYDLTPAARVRVGRPALGKGVSPSPRISFRAPPHLYCTIQARAAAEGRSVSEIAREAIERYIKS